jgi:hypothetical protein
MRLAKACPSPRELRSTTHKVWGCGFGATGSPGARDTGIGIPIEGRQTYYCTFEQSGCRRTARP